MMEFMELSLYTDLYKKNNVRCWWQSEKNILNKQTKTIHEVKRKNNVEENWPTL